MKTKSIICATVLLLCNSVCADDVFSLRTWTSSEGNELKAKLLGIDDTQLTLQPVNKPKVKVDIARLSQQDQQIIRDKKNKIVEQIQQGSFGPANTLKEDDLFIAFKFNLLKDLVAAASQKNVKLSLIPRKITKESDQVVFIVGDKIGIRFTNTNKYETFFIQNQQLLIRETKQIVCALNENKVFNSVFLSRGLTHMQPQQIGIEQTVVLDCGGNSFLLK